ncbi:MULTISPECIES: hypothetical protein [unclassified Mesorhizobium]|nr:MULTISPECIES: hypothetical protein [unclassified Mesorhizobium]
MLSLIRTLLDGAGAKAEDRLKDQFAVDLSPSTSAMPKPASPAPSRRSPR